MTNEKINAFDGCFTIIVNNADNEKNINKYNTVAGERAPGWIALRRELPSARVKHIAAAFGAKGMKQQSACIGIARVDEYRDHLKVAARLFLGPGARPG